MASSEADTWLEKLNALFHLLTTMPLESRTNVSRPARDELILRENHRFFLCPCEGNYVCTREEEEVILHTESLATFIACKA